MYINKYFYLFLLYPPQRGYISFVNTFVTPRNNDLRPYVPWRHLISAKFLGISAVCGNHDCVRTIKCYGLESIHAGLYCPYTSWY